MTLSVNNNSGAQLALQSLDTASSALSKVQSQVSSTLQVASAQDDPAAWAIAQGQRSQVSALSAVTAGLNRGSSIADVGVGAGQTVSDLLNQLKAKVLSATDSTIDTPTRASITSDFQSLLGEISHVVQNASFDGVNVLDGSTTGLQFLANAGGTQQITVSGLNLSLGGPLIPFAATTTLGTPTTASAVLSQVDTAISAVNTALGALGEQSNQLGAHAGIVGQLSTVLNTSVGALVDADLSADSARLQALQVSQQLGAQALQVASSTPQTILSLFKGG